ncbi:MFS transporter [Pedobacter arcticus]|uniref:MFS transporter n=1 Tax=Pedobacter arcticus TaxID=752140 RepID=UPI00037B00F9|nr:MFS transporter [Pedobacter arcticus]
MQIKSAFRSFSNHNFTLFFSGQLVSRIGMWMQRTAVIWLIYSITDSVFMVGVATFAEQFPSFLFSIRGGIIADKYNKYKVLMITQILSALQAVVLTILAFSGNYNITLILLLSAFLGVVNAYDIPVRQSMINDIIDNREDLSNAVALNSTLNNLARLAGPALAGFVLAKFGADYCFLANSVSFIAVIGAIMAMHLPQYKNQALKNETTAKTNFKDGWNYLLKHPEISYPLMIAALSSLLVLPYITLLPVYAKDIFKGGASIFGWLNSAIGIGAFVGAFYLASLTNVANFRRILLVNSIILGISLLCFAYSSNLYVSLFFILISGFSAIMQSSTVMTIIQSESEPKYRGRMISFVAMALFGMLPLGSLFVGYIEPIIGTTHTLFIEGIAGIIIGIAFYTKLLLNKL